MSTHQPSGIVTLLFTDIEGSTRLLRTLSAEAAVEAFALHNRLLREASASHGGFEKRTEGDSFFIVFQDATRAVAAAVLAQRRLAAQTWPGDVPVRVRMGLHTCEPTQVDGDYFGLEVHRAARIAAAGHGGQVLLSQATRSAELPAGVTLRDLGEHRLKDLARPEWIYELQIEGLNHDFPPLNSLETPSNLPASVTRLVGRESDVAAVDHLLRRDDVRMVTITGTGGSGKTRLAIAAAEGLGDVFRNGLILVDLTTVTDPAQVAGAIAMAIEVPIAPGVSTIESVTTQLRDRAVLLVLDNFEHVAAAAGDLATLLSGARRVKAIVTSRAALHITAEHEYPLELLSSDASLELFVERARATRPSFELTAAGAAQVREICARLDHLPLAVELAAARVRHLSLEQVLAQLGSRLALLEGGPRDVPARQQTLRGTIAWSYDLLPPEAAALLRRAAVFVGSLALDALESVSDDDPTTSAGIEALLDQSLLRQDSETGRFSLLETIREFALEQARIGGELAETSRKHATFFADLVSQTAAPAAGTDRAARRKRLDIEQPNLLAALEWALDTEPPQAEPAAVIAVALGTRWYEHGLAVEGATWLWRTHALEGIPPGLRAQLARALGVLLDQQADKAGAAGVLEEAVGLFRQVGDRVGQARALNSLGSASRTGGSTARARALFEEALLIRAEVGDEGGVSVTTFNLAQLAMDDGDFGTARRLYEKSNRIDTSLGDEWGAALGSLGIAAAAVAQGDLYEATTRLRSAVQFFLDAEDEDHLAEALFVCADQSRALRQYERAARLLGAADGLWARLGLPLAPADAVHVERCRSAVEAVLGPEGFARATEQGHAMTADQAVAFALQ